jgi:uncharacterized protein YgiB involved in biofilm formation
MGTGAALSVAACEDDKTEKAAIYETIAQCVADGNSQATCDKARTDAFRLSADVAPKFDSKTECEEAYGVGACADDQAIKSSFDIGNDEATKQAAASHGGSGSTFIYYRPWPTAYMFGSTVQSQPIYVSRGVNGGFRDAGYHTASGTSVSRSAGTVSLSKAATVVPRTSAVVSRGGFGGISAGAHGGSSS